MDRWEYKLVLKEGGFIPDFLNKHGNDGWELCGDGADPVGYYIFKRRLPARAEEKGGA